MSERQDSLEHDSLDDRKKAFKRAPADKMLRGDDDQVLTKAELRRLARQARRIARGSKKWLSVDNPAIWEGDED